MRTREEILKKCKEVSVLYATLEVLLDIRNLLKEISDKIRDDTVK